MERERPRFGMWAGAALAAGLGLRLWFLQHGPAIAGDALVYGAIAKNLLQHGVYGFNQDTVAPGVTRVVPTLIRLPGYPLFLAACFRIFGMENYRAALYVQAAFDLWTCLLAAGLAGRVFRGRARLGALWAAVLCPFTANYVATPLTETLVLWTVALAFYALRRWQEKGAGLNRWVWVLGFALAYSVLLRPDQGLLSAAVVPAMLWTSLRRANAGAAGWIRRAQPAVIAAACVVLPLVPWTLRNWHTFHVFQPLAPRSAADPGERTPQGFNLWFRTWSIDFVSTDEVYWNVNGARISPGDLPDRAFALGCTAGGVPRAQLPLYRETMALFADYDVTAVDTAALDARFASLAHRKMAAAPFCASVLLPLARLGDMLVRPRTELTTIPDRWWEPPFSGWKRRGVVASMALDVVYLVLAVWGVGIALRCCGGDARVLLWGTIAMVLLRAALLLTLDNAEPRYTLEFFPIFFVWMGAIFEPCPRGERDRVT